MNRDELAKELDVQPWYVDDWLLWGCPAIKIRTQWQFDIEQVRSWLKNRKNQSEANEAASFTRKTLI